MSSFFGGGGSSSSNSNNSSSSSSSSGSGSSIPGPLLNPLSSSSSPSSPSSASAKSRIVSTIQQEQAVNNARALISKVNENCFASCIPNPGSSLTSKEQTCLSSCMEKYIDSWNVVSRVYVGRLSRDAPGAVTGAFPGAGAGEGSGLL